MNVLFLAGGRRITLAEQFEARGFKVYGYEADLFCPLGKGKQREIIQAEGKWDSDCYHHVKRLIRSIGDCLVIPLSDEASYFAATWGLSVCCSSYGAKAARDKLRLAELAADNEVLQKYYPFPNKYPLIYKPRYGYGSKGIIKETSYWWDKSLYLVKNRTHIAQQFIDGTEYSADAYFSSTTSECIGVSVRTRDRIGDGEVIESATIPHKLIERAVADIGKNLMLRGPVCMQFIDSNHTFRPYLIEINARFGGGATLSIEAGLDMIDMIKREYVKKEEIWPHDYRVKLGMRMKRVYRDYYYGI